MAVDLSGLQVSVSKAKKFRRCPNAYRYKYVEGWTPKVRGLALERGSWIHALLEAYYLGKNWKKVHKRLLRTFDNLFEEQKDELGNMPADCLNIFTRYLDHYGDKDLKQFNVIDAELDEIITLPNGLELRIIIDLVMEDKRTGAIWLWDHKTRKKFQDTEQTMLDPQLTLYHYGAAKLGFENIAGVVMNELSTQMPTLPELLKTGGLSKRANLVCDVWTYEREIRRHGLDRASYGDYLLQLAVRNKDRFFRRSYMPKDPPMLKTMVNELMQTALQIQDAERRQHFPRTFIPNDCKWSCEYKDICIVELHGGDPKDVVKNMYETRDQRRARERRERIAGEVKRVGSRD